jgi:hypothetical protein
MGNSIINDIPVIKNIEEDLPRRSDSQDQFTNKANRFFASLPEWQQSLSNFGGWIQSTAQQTSDLRDEVEQFKENSEQQVDLAKAEVKNCQAEVERAKQQADLSLAEADRATQQADRAEMHQKSAEVAAAAAGSTAGLPTLTGKANQVLTVNSAGDGVHWRQSGRVGDILETAGSPAPGYLPMNGGEYRAADYPELAKIMPKAWWHSVSEYSDSEISPRVVYLGLKQWICYKDRFVVYSNNNGKSWREFREVFPGIIPDRIHWLSANPRTGRVVFTDNPVTGIFSTNRKFQSVSKFNWSKYGIINCNPSCGQGEWLIEGTRLGSVDDGATWIWLPISPKQNVSAIKGGWLYPDGGSVCKTRSIEELVKPFYFTGNSTVCTTSGRYDSEICLFGLNGGNQNISFDGGSSYSLSGLGSDYSISCIGDGVFATQRDGRLALVDLRKTILATDIRISDTKTNSDYNPDDGVFVFSSGRKIITMSASQSDAKFYVPVRESKHANVYIKARP